jgi:hypothetical protein
MIEGTLAVYRAARLVVADAPTAPDAPRAETA